MELTGIIKTHQYHLYEKYYSFLSELLNLKNMIHLYKERVQMKDDISEEIIELSSRIKLFYESTKELTNHGKFISFIISLDKRKVELEEIARHIKLIHEYVLQNITEKFSYLNTFPPLQKRYSSKALTEVLDSHHEALYKAIASSSDKKLIYSVWSHSDNYRLKSFSNKSYFTQHSFYYHDIVWNIPTIIDHEVILAALQNNNECNTWVKEVSKNIVEKYSTLMKKNKKYSGNEKLSFEERTYYKEFDDFLRGNIRPLLWELLSDFVGFKLYGQAYIKSFLHETLGEFFGREFFDLDGNRHDNISVSVTINRDSLLLRQLILLESCAYDNRDIDRYENDMFVGLSDIIGIGNTDINESSLVQLIRSSVNENRKHVDEDRRKELTHHLESAKLYSINMKIIYVLLLEYTSEKPDIEIDIDTPFIKDGQNSIVLELWNERDNLLKRDKMPHRSILRQKLLGEKHKPCILHRSHTVKSPNNTGSDELAFGQFNRIYIEDIEDTEIDILDKIDGLINSFSMHSDKFDIKHALLRVAKSDKEYTSIQPIRLYMMLYLKNGNMKNSMDLLNKIEEKIKSTYESDPKYALYKSYGPEDIVIEIDFDDDEEIWKFIELIRSEFKNDIKETFSSIVMLDYKDVTLNNNIWIKGYYRLLPDVKFQDLYKRTENIEPYKKLLKTNSMRILDITNKYYDFEIWWNTENIEQIIRYENVLGNTLLDSTYFIVSSNNSLKYGKATKTKSRKGIS